jgi:chromosome segregation ATPase
MRSILVTCLAVSSIALFAGGCANQKAENERLLAERNTLQSEVESEKAANAAAQEKVAELDKQVTALKGELDAARTALAQAQTEGTQKLKDADAAADKRAADLQRKMDAAAKTAAAEIKELADKLAKATADLSSARSSAASASATLSDKIDALQKKVDDLTKENEALKAAAKTAPATMPAD